MTQNTFVAVFLPLMPLALKIPNDFLLMHLSRRENYKIKSAGGFRELINEEND